MSDLLIELNNNDMREFWNGIGGRKWVSYQDRLDSSLIAFGHEAMTTAQIAPGEQVLDIGCGCGDTSLEIAAKIGPSGKVTGVDVSKVILNQAQERAYSISNINFVCVDAQYCDFEPLACDLVYSRFGVMFFSDPGAALGNIRKALKPGGRMVFVCWQPIKQNQWINLPLEIATKYAPPPPPSSSQDPGAFSFGDTRRIKEVLEVAGFSSVLIRPYNTKFNLGHSLIEAVDFISTIGPSSYLMDDSGIDANIKAGFLRELHQTLSLYATEHSVSLDASAWIVSAVNQ